MTLLRRINLKGIMLHFFAKKLHLYFFSIFFISTLFAQESTNPTVLVSIAPHKFFVEKIAGSTVDVYLMVPAGASAHTYEPTPRQILIASQGEIWFRVGESFETRAINALKNRQNKLEIVDMRQNVDLITHSPHHKGCCGGSEDLHFWLSARQAKIQAQTIAQALTTKYPHHRDTYRANLETFQMELENLDKYIANLLEPIKHQAILVSHPAYAYFCRDYELKQLSIEMEGKDPTPQQMTQLLNMSRQLCIRTIFIQMQYNNKAAKLVAHTLGANIIVLDPYSENYFVCMKEIANAFANS